MTQSRVSWQAIALWLDRRDRLVIAAVALLSVWAAGEGGAALSVLPCYALLGACCAAITLIDARQFLIPDRLSILLLACGVVCTVIGGGPILQRLGAVAGLWLAMRLFAAMAQHVKGRDSFGQGDVKLIAVSGIWLQADDLAPFVTLSALTAIGMHVVQGVVMKEAGTDPRIPFGSTLAPMLAAFVLLRQVIEA